MLLTASVIRVMRWVGTTTTDSERAMGACGELPLESELKSSGRLLGELQHERSSAHIVVPCAC